MKNWLWVGLFAALVMLGGCGDDDDSPDAALLDAGSCNSCPANTNCVMRFNRQCVSTGAHCEPSPQVCPAATCTPECEMAVCGGGDGGSGLTCQNRILCGGELSGAFTCYEK